MASLGYRDRGNLLAIGAKREAADEIEPGSQNTKGLAPAAAAISSPARG